MHLPQNVCQRGSENPEPPCPGWLEGLRLLVLAQSPALAGGERASGPGSGRVPYHPPLPPPPNTGVHILQGHLDVLPLTREREEKRREETTGGKRDSKGRERWGRQGLAWGLLCPRVCPTGMAGAGPSPFSGGARGSGDSSFPTRGMQGTRLPWAREDAGSFPGSNGVQESPCPLP